VAVIVNGLGFLHTCTDTTRSPAKRVRVGTGNYLRNQALTQDSKTLD